MRNTPSSREKLGKIIGKPLGTLFELGSYLRHSRLVHRVGEVYLAETHPIATRNTLARRLGRQLEGAALVRLSNSLWNEGVEWPDLLGCAIRFGWQGETEAQPEKGEQDLLMLSTRRVWTLPLSFATTNVHNFLANCYYGVSPFRFEQWKGLEVRLVPVTDDVRGRSRWETLEIAVAEGAAVFRLDVRQKQWEMAARITLRERLPFDQQALRFSPFNDGARLMPQGFVQWLRLAAYPRSQRGRATARRAA